MATIKTLTSVAFTLTGGNTVTIEEPLARRAFDDFLNGRPIYGEGTIYAPSAVVMATPTYAEDEVDMTDDFCLGSSGCDGDFKLRTPQGSFCINASDITGCDEYDEELFPSALLEGAVLTDGDAYTSNVSPTSYYVGDGKLAVHGLAFFENVGSGVRVYFAFAEGSSCDEKAEQVKSMLTEHAVEVYYGGGGGPGPK